MTLGRRRLTDRDTGERSYRLRRILPVSVFLFSVLALTQVPVVSAHGGTATAVISQWHGIALALSGIGLLGGAVVCKRANRISPTVALYGVLAGIAVTALGAVLFDGLSPEPTYAASSIPFPRPWYQSIALLAGLLIATTSLIVGLFRWPNRPRYTFLGILMGVWVAYPYLLPGSVNDSHPLGYAIVLGTPLLVGYVIWKDAGGALQIVLRDSVARRFGAGIAVIIALFFVSITGYLSVFPEPGLPHENKTVVLPVIYQLVTWPTLEVVRPHIPLFLAVSPAQVLIVGSLSTLVGLNASLIAYQWRANQQAGIAEGTTGSAAVVGSCTCGCCGPLVAKIALLAAGPSVAAPLYWIFVDTASPLSVLFIVGSLVLFTGSIVHAVESTWTPRGSTAVVSAD